MVIGPDIRVFVCVKFVVDSMVLSVGVLVVEAVNLTNLMYLVVWGVGKVGRLMVTRGLVWCIVLSMVASD